MTVLITLEQILATLAAYGVEELALPSDDHQGRAALHRDTARTWRLVHLATDLPAGPDGHLLVLAAHVVARRFDDAALVSRVMAEQTS